MEKIGKGFNFLNWIKSKGEKGVYLVYLACLSYSSYHCRQHSSSFPSPTQSVAIPCLCIFVPPSCLETFFRKLLPVSEACQLLNAYYSVFHYIHLQGTNEMRTGSFTLIIILSINPHTPTANFFTS